MSPHPQPLSPEQKVQRLTNEEIRVIQEALAGVEQTRAILEAYDGPLNRLRDERNAALREVERLQQENQRQAREIELLRHYGNNACTAMADEALEEERNGPVER